MGKVDILSPSLLSGLLGYAATGDAFGFWIGAVGLWFALTALFVIASALSNREPRLQSHQATGGAQLAE